jgi:hypothetical protein
VLEAAVDRVAPEEADAVKLALTRKVAVLTGGPGCC